MALAISHLFVSAKSDPIDTTLVRPSNWNAAHVLAGAASVAQGGTGLSAAGAAGTVLVGGDPLAWSASPTLTGRLTLQGTFAPAANADAYPFFVQPTITEAGSGTHQLFAGLYVAAPIINAGAAAVTDAAAVFIYGQPNAAGASNRSLYIYSGNSVIRDRLGVGAVTTPAETLTVYGPNDSNYTARFRTSNVAGPYGVVIEEASGSAVGYPLLQVGDTGIGNTWFRVDSGGAVVVGTGGLAIGTTPATTGAVRVGNNVTAVGARNVANSGNLTLVATDNGDGQYFGDSGGQTRVRSSLAAAASPADGDWWVECVGTSPSRVCALKVRDAGATRTIASLTY